MKWSQFLIIIAVIVGTWVSLFITVIDQSSRTRTLEGKVVGLTSELKSAQAAASTARAKQLDTTIADLQCIGDYFAITNHIDFKISNLNKCTISGSFGGATGATKSD